MTHDRRFPSESAQYRAARAVARHVDRMWPLGHLLDATPGGRDDFHPRLRYGR